MQLALIQLGRVRVMRLRRTQLFKSVLWVFVYRFLIWAVAIGYLVAESRELYELQQFTQLTQFALFFLLANFQLNIARFYKITNKLALAIKLKNESLLMFFASVLAVAEAAIDHTIPAISAGSWQELTPLLGAFFVLNWLLNLVMIGLAAYSLERTVGLLSRDLSEDFNKLD